MLVVIAGLIGAGKSSIAREASKRLNIPLYSIDDDKKRIYRQHPKYEYFLKNNIPFPDETRRRTFGASLHGLKKWTIMLLMRETLSGIRVGMLHFSRKS